MARDTGRDVREEIKIALFWRALIGDYEYIKFDPEDMMRWYDALELRGPVEIRQMMRERYSTRPVPAVLGIVGRAPHPPVWLVRDWLAHYEQQVHTRHLWLGTACFLVLSFMAFPMLYGCTRLTPVSMYVMNPPNNQPTTYTPAGPIGSNYNPSLFQPPGVTMPAAPSAMATPSSTGPQSTGIAGAASGQAPAGGATGPVNSGLSAGASAPSASSSSGQP